MDAHDSDNEDNNMNQIFEKNTKQIKFFNDLRKHVIKGDVDKNSIFVDLMQTMSPRTVGLKLQFYKGS